MACPSEEAVLAFLDGDLTPRDKAGLEEHLGGCPRCARLLAASIDAAFPSPDAPAGGAGREEAPMSGGRIGRYLVRGPIGAGGMGVVYAAYDPELGRQVALKLLHTGHEAGGEASVRLLREAQAMARLSHPNVVAVYDTGTWDGRVFLAMELVEGGTLAGWRRAAPRPWREVVAVFISAGRGLAAAHAAGLVHRDFKPENVLIGADGSVRVTDFGLARMAEDKLTALPVVGMVAKESINNTGSINSTHSIDSVGSARPGEEPGAVHSPLTRAGALIGSLAYMAPEQMAGLPADARSDIFSFCVALFECLGGERPFAGDTLYALRKSMSEASSAKSPSACACPRSCAGCSSAGCVRGRKSDTPRWKRCSPS